MDKSAVVSVQELLHKKVAAFDFEGQPVADALLASAAKNQPVVLSFAGMSHVMTAFLHATVGAVLLAYPKFDNQLTIVGLEHVPYAQVKLAEVKKLALNEEYRQRLNEAWDTELASC